MKKRFQLMFIFCLCIGFARAQSPQAVNFLPRSPYNSYAQHFVVEGDNLWFCGSNSLIQFNIPYNSQTIFKPDNSDMNGSGFNGICADTNGTMYCTTYSQGLYTFDGTNFYNYDTLITGEKITGCYTPSVDYNGNVYMTALIDAYNYVGIVKFDGNSLSNLTLPNGVSYNVSDNNSFVVDKNNKLFLYGYALGTAKTYIYDGVIWDSVSAVSATSNDFLITTDINKEAWLVPGSFNNATTTYTFYKWNGNSWSPNIVHFNAPINGLVRDITVDSTNTFWLCCESQIVKKMGTNLYTLNTPNVYSSPNNFLSYFSSFVVMPNGDFLCRFTNWKEWIPYEDVLWHYNTFTSAWQATDVYCDIGAPVSIIKIDKWNRKWAMAMWQGLYQLVGSTWQRINPPNGFTYPDAAYDFDFDINGNLLVILFDANYQSHLLKYNGQTWSLFGNNSLLIDVAENNLGDKFLVGGSSGEFYHLNTWQSFDFIAQFGGNVYSVEPDEYDNFWMCTEFGLVLKFDGTNFVIINSLPGFTLGYATCRIDKMGYLWIQGSDSALYCLDINNPNAINTVAYNPSYFPNQAIANGGYTDIEGNKWFSTNKGLMKFDGTNWATYTKENTDFMGISPSSIQIDNSNNIWGIDELGVTIFNESGISSIYTQTIFNFMEGNCYYDINGNGIQNANDYPLANQKIMILPDSFVRVSNGLGNYKFICDSVNYNIYPFSDTNWMTTSNPSNYNIFVYPQGADSLDFGLKMTTNMDSLELHIWGSNSRCSYFNTYFINYTNKGSSILSGDIILTMDSLETFSSAFPSADSLSPYSYSWHFTNLYPFQSQNISITVQSPNWQSMGQTINGNAHAFGTNFNEIALYSNILTCAYDPNDKTSKPLGEHYLHQIKPDCPLEYLIRFQNTGNDVAFNIAVEDTISPYLDMNTFELLGASHFVETKYAQNGAVRFEFPLIMLPDSNQNEALSHGFVAYRIKPKANVSLPAVIENTAFIYFDQNPAVVTNTTRDTMTQFYVGINAPTPQNELLISPNPFDNQTIVTYLNPSGEGCEVLVYDLSGKLLIRKMDNMGRFSIEKGNLQSGMYLLKVKGKKEMSAKLVVW